MPSTYEEFQAQTSSEKLGLVAIEASKRVVGWALYSGSIYEADFSYAVITAVTADGVALTASTTLAGVTAGKYYLDRSEAKLYLRTSGSVDPSTLFIAVTFRLFFADAAVRAPWDLSTGFDVAWLPYFRSSSSFSFEVDNKNQAGTAIEGDGSITLLNDRAFWASRFDKLTFENQRVFVYSWHRNLPATEASLIFRGRIQGKSFSEKEIKFSVKDMIAELRAAITLENIEDATYTSSYGGGGDARVPTRARTAKQRRIYGPLKGNVPTNIDRVLDGYPLQGTFTVTEASATVTAGGSHVITRELKQNDRIKFGSDEVWYTIAAMTGATTFTLSEEYEGSTGSKTAEVKPTRETFFTNRVFQVAGHALSRPSSAVIGGYSVVLFEVADGSIFRDGEQVELNGYFRTIDYVSENVIRVTSGFPFLPTSAMTCYRSAVQNVYLNDELLNPETDYDYNASTAQITLSSDGYDSAEVLIAPIRKLSGSSAFTASSRTMTGTGTFYTKELRAGDWVLPNSASTASGWRMVWTVVSDTEVTLATGASGNTSGATTYKSPDYYKDGETTLSCDVYGTTEDGTVTGAFLRTAPKIVEHMLETAGLTSLLSSSTFDSASVLCPHDCAVAIPKNSLDQKTPTVRDVANEINQSVMGILYQTSDFLFAYSTLRPGRSTTTGTTFRESDILSMSVKSDSSKIVRAVNVEYQEREYSPLDRGRSTLVYSFTNNRTDYLSGVTKELNLKSVLVNEDSARIFASRWAALYSTALSSLSFETKLKASLLSVNDCVIIEHEKLYERVGSASGIKVGLIQKIERTTVGNKIEIDDLGNALSRCATITSDSAEAYGDATASQRAVNGYITDSEGVVGDDVDTEGVNLIW